MVSTSDSFSLENGKSRPTPVSSTMKNFFCSAAAGNPQPRANTSASRAIRVRLNLPSGQSARWMRSFSVGVAR